MTAAVAVNTTDTTDTKKRGFFGQEVEHTHYWRSELPKTGEKRSFAQLFKEELDATGYWRTKKNLIGKPSTTVRSS